MHKQQKNDDDDDIDAECVARDRTQSAVRFAIEQST